MNIIKMMILLVYVQWDTGPSRPARTAFEAFFISSLGGLLKSLTDVVFVLLLSCICMHHWRISGALSSAANPPKIAQAEKNVQWLQRDFTFQLILCVHYTHFFITQCIFAPLVEIKGLEMFRHYYWCVGELLGSSYSLKACLFFLFVSQTHSLMWIFAIFGFSLCFDISGTLL